MRSAVTFRLDAMHAVFESMHIDARAQTASRFDVVLTALLQSFGTCIVQVPRISVEPYMPQTPEERAKICYRTKVEQGTGGLLSWYHLHSLVRQCYVQQAELAHGAGAAVAAAGGARAEVPWGPTDVRMPGVELRVRRDAVPPAQLSLFG